MQVPKYFGPRLDPVAPFWRLTVKQKVQISRHFIKVSEGTRTPDRLDHNQELYQLSYAHQVDRSV